MSGRFTPPMGSHANLWNAAAAGAGGTSAAFNSYSSATVSYFGNSSGATTLTLQYSADGTNWYDGPQQAGVNGDFAKDFYGVNAQYLRLKTSAAVTITATMQAKPDS